MSDTQWLVLERRIPAPEFIIGGVGTEMHDPLDARLAADFHAAIAPGWDRAKVEHVVERLPGVHRQPAEFLNPCKASWHWPHASIVDVAHLKAHLAMAGLDVTVSYTNDVYLDVVPRFAGKGNALAWLCRRIGVALDQVLVAGAGANNASMFALPGVRGLLVGNASPELAATAGPFHILGSRELGADAALRTLQPLGVLVAPGLWPATAAKLRSPAG